MERLSTSPFAIRRLNPSSDSLAFEVDTSIVRNMSGMTLQQLLEGGRLFYIDHSYQAKMNRTERFAAACDAYFLIDNTTGNFLPLAIRTGVGANLIYTPLDEQADWQLAKIMFNVNDFVFTQMHHLGAMHEVLHVSITQVLLHRFHPSLLLPSYRRTTIWETLLTQLSIR